MCTKIPATDKSQKARCMDNPAVQPHLTSRLSPFCAVWVLIVSSSASLAGTKQKSSDSTQNMY